MLFVSFCAFEQLQAGNGYTDRASSSLLNLVSKGSFILDFIGSKEVKSMRMALATSIFKLHACGHIVTRYLWYCMRSVC